MLQLFYKKDGAISVFLTLVLVPMIVVCCCFIDLSRVRLARGMIESAGDLAMNTSMTNFDQTLNEVYGMLASCQSMDEVQDHVSAYFQESLTSKGMDPTQIQTFMKSLNNLLGMAGQSEDMVDYIGITMVDNSFSLEEVANGNMTNPAVIKEEIVNFMKYRSVIDGVQNLIEIFTGASNATKHAKEDTEMVKAQQKAAEKEKDALESLKKLYQKMKTYQDLGITKDYLEGLVQQGKNFETLYRDAHNLVVQNLLNYESYMETFNSAYKIKTNAEISVSVPPNPNKNTYKTAIKDYNNALSDYMKSAFKNTNNMYKQVNEMIEESGSNQWQYYVQTYKKLKNSGVISNYVNAANKLQKRYRTLKKVKENIDAKGTVIDDENDRITAATYIISGSVKNAGNSTEDWNYDEWYDHLTGQHSKITQDYNNWYGSFYSKMEGYGNYLVSSHTKTDSVQEKVKDVYDQLKGSGGILDTLEKAKDKLENAKAKISGAKSAVHNYETAVDNWSNKVNVSSSDFADDQKEILNNMKTEEGSLYGKVTEAGLDNLNTRMTELSQNFTMLINMFKAMSYGGKKLTNIKNYNNFKSACQNCASKDSIPINQTALENYCRTTFESDQGYHGVPAGYDLSWAANKSPDLSKDAEPDKPAVYKVLDENYKDQKEDSDTEKYEKYKSDSEDTSKSNDAISEEVSTPYTTSVNVEIKDKPDLPSGGTGGLVDVSTTNSDVGEAGAETQNLFQQIASVISDIAVTCRDKLFVTDYIMSMFTYDTFTNEKLCEIAGNEPINRNVSKLEKVKSMLASPPSEVKTAWENTSKLETRNKTITNELLNIDNNDAYGNEVEYILYGGSNTVNKAKVYAIIFAVQFSMNTIYGFSNFWSATSTDETAIAINAIAEAIFAASGGIVPPSVSKVVLILALVAVETAYDIQCFKAGMKVALIKDEHTWAYSLSQATEGNMLSSAYDPDSSNKLKLAYSDYLSVLLFIKQFNPEDAKKVYLRTADVIQVNMQKRLNNSGYLLKNARTYFHMKANFTVHPLMLKLPIVLNSGLASNNPKDDPRWYTLSYDGIRGYY